MAAIQNLFNLPFGNYPRRDIYRIPLILPIPKFRVPIKVTNGLSSSLQSKTHKILHQFDPNIPLEEAATPPSSWYFDPSFYSLELDHVFYAGWQVVGISSPASIFYLPLILFCLFIHLFDVNLMNNLNLICILHSIVYGVHDDFIFVCIILHIRI